MESTGTVSSSGLMALMKPKHDKDCNTCTHHMQGQHPPHDCQICMAMDLAMWEPKREIKVMSDGPTEMYRDEENLMPTGRIVFGPMDHQVGGDHYKSMKIQPLEFAVANGLDFFQKDIIKYVTRRNGDKAKRIEDLHKAKHYLEMYIETVENDKI